jgi:hypothetical protein
MLNWKNVDGSWFGNGFRIQKVDSTLWLLEETASGAAVTVADPIAELPTLQAAKYKAEGLHQDRVMNMRRRRMAAIAAAAWSIAVLSAHPVVFLLTGAVGIAAALEIVATWFEGRVGRAREMTQ